MALWLLFLVTSQVIIVNGRQAGQGPNHANLPNLSEAQQAKAQASTCDNGQSEHDDGCHEEDHHEGVHLFSWRWNEIYYGSSKFFRPVLVTALIIFAIIFKIIFHHLTFLERILPESCVLIVVGTMFGLIMTQTFDEKETENETENPFPKFTANLFFNLLLPPIILDSSISLYKKEFFATFYSVIIFAVFGTLFNVLTIGLSLFGLSKIGAFGEFVNSKTFEVESLGLFPCLAFGSLISAVDPVAVLAIFEQIEVNAGLYFLVFGESLFNDGVCVVLYNSMNTLASMNRAVVANDIFMAIMSFFCVALGGAIIGFLHGLFCSIISRFTKHVRIVEPLTILCCAYSTFLWAELFHWSGIISIISYGVTAKHWAFQNISQKSFTTVKYAVKTLASTSDCLIFLFLGMSIFTEKHFTDNNTYHAGFIIATILLCLIFRLLSTLSFSALVNLKRLDKITLREQLIMTWGGLRGAVGFSLAMVLQEGLWYRELFVTTALVMVLFTVFLQGGTIKLLVKQLNIELESDQGSVIGVEVQDKVMEDITSGMVAVCGNQGARGRLANRLRGLDKKVKKLLIHDDSKSQLQRRFEKISVSEHFTNLYAPRIIAEKSKGAGPLNDSDVTKKVFRKEMRRNQWSNLRSVSVEEGPRSRSLLREMERKARNTRELGLQVLDPRVGREEEDEQTLLCPDSPLDDLVIQKIKAQYASVQAKKSGHAAKHQC